MTKTKTRNQYRDWIRSRYGTIYKTDSNDKHKKKQWRINQKHIIESFIEHYDGSGYEPEYLITRNYYYEQHDLKKVKADNKRLNNVLEDALNTRGISNYWLNKDHFIERHKPKMVKKHKKHILNTITGELEPDWCNVEIQEGGFHIHSLVSAIDDDVIYKPSRKVQKYIEKVYGVDQIPCGLLEDDWGMTKVKVDLLNAIIRDRCDFLGNSGDSLNITPASEHAGYDGYTGWQGMVAYSCKQMYNVDRIDEIYDKDNSTLLEDITN